MPNQTPAPALQNHFQAGLKTEFTGLNFPENAATSTDNCVYTLTGDVLRRGGINAEANHVINEIDQASVAQSSYIWKNVGGDGQTQMLVKQVGSNIYFFQITNATTSNGASNTLIPTIVNIALNQAPGNTNNVALTECQYADGNGFLVIFHKDCDPTLCAFNSLTQVITPTLISLQTRDFIGIPEPGVADNFRPSTLSQEHLYNLVNQGWTQGANYTASGNPNAGGTGPGGAGAVSAGGSTAGYPLLYNAPITGASWYIPIITESSPSILTVGAIVNITFQIAVGGNTNQNAQVTGVVTSYTAGTDIIINVLSSNYWASGSYNNQFAFFGFWSGGNIVSDPFAQFGVTLNISIFNKGFIGTWHTDLLNFPSNSDVWWLYKDNTGVFNPTTTFVNVQQNVGAAPKGSQILNPWNQDRSTVSGVSGLTPVVTTARPSTGAWYQGRIFYTGVNASQQPTGDEPYTTWTENIYFSQIVQTSSDFGKCFQVNDPSAQDLFSILPSDGGVITIQGCGQIYKLFALRFGLLVFAANGVWFIAGSTGIGFAANDYTIVKISNIQSISATSFIDVVGYPLFWNAEGIYQVTPTQQAGSAHSPDIQLDVQNMVIGTINTFYSDIPQTSIQFARGDYDKLNFIVTWVYKTTQETGIVDRYQMDGSLSYNTITKAFYPYTFPNKINIPGLANTLCDVKYIQLPSGITTPPPTLKYITEINLGAGPQFITFFEENDFTTYTDFAVSDPFNTGAGYDYSSFFVAGYNLPGQGVRKIQMPYCYLFFREPANSACQVQSLWDYAIAGTSGRWSAKQLITNNIDPTKFNMLYRRVRLLGRGLAVQLKIQSVTGQPFDIMGWSVWDVINPGV